MMQRYVAKKPIEELKWNNKNFFINSKWGREVGIEKRKTEETIRNQAEKW